MSGKCTRGVCLRLSPEVIVKHLEQAALLVHLPTNNIFELNETGARVLELLDEGLDADEIVSRLVVEFDVEAGHASDEVDDLFTRLKATGLLI